MKLKDLLIGLIALQVLIGLFYIFTSFEYYKHLITSPRIEFDYFLQFSNVGINFIASFLGVLGLILYFSNNLKLNRILKLYIIHHTFIVMGYFPTRMIWIFFSGGNQSPIPWYTHLFYLISIALIVISILYYSQKRNINVLPVPVSSQGPRFLNYTTDYIYVMLITLGCTNYFINGYGPFGNSYMSYVFGIIWALLLPFIYYTVCESAFQQTLGKVLSNTYVRANNRERASFGKIALRSICRYIPFEAFSYIPTPMSKWHDKFSGTDVFYPSNVQFEAEPIMDHLITQDDLQR